MAASSNGTPHLGAGRGTAPPDARCVALRGDLLAEGGHDVSLYRNGECVFAPGGGGAVRALVYRDQVISGGDDGLIRFWGDGRVLEATGPVIAMAVSPDGRWLVAGSERGLRLWDLRTGTNVGLEPAGASNGTWERGIGTSEAIGVVRRAGDLGFSADSQRLTAILILRHLLRDYDTVATWNLEDGRRVGLQVSQEVYYSAATAITEDGRLLTGEMRLMDWPDDIRCGVRRVRALDVRGVRAACATFEGEIMTWTLPDRDLRQVGHDGNVVALLLLPDGRVLTSSGD